jgi:hypothetical protein
MIAGMVAGGSIWGVFLMLFLIFPEPLSLAAALIVGPWAGGYFAARLSGRTAASVVTIVCVIATLAFSVVYVPHTSWEYPHGFWAGVPLLVILLVLGNFIFIFLGTLIGIQVRTQGHLKQRALNREPVKSAQGQILAVKATDMPSYPLTRIEALVLEERHLANDLAVINEKKEFEGLSPELVSEKKVALEKKLLDIVLEKERLIRETM